MYDSYRHVPSVVLPHVAERTVHAVYKLETELVVIFNQFSISTK